MVLNEDLPHFIDYLFGHHGEWILYLVREVPLLSKKVWTSITNIKWEQLGVVKIIGLAIVVILMLVVFIKACSYCCKCGKTMKAPGRNMRIFRSRFEQNPRGYFRQLRSDLR
ncbi:hypothetical protein AMTRI_Chr02g213330 [Amborella trichopoda]